MSLAAAINSVLAVAGVQALVDERIYPVIAPQNVQKPYVVWRRNGGDPLSVLSGNSARRQFVDLFIGAYATTFDQADAIGEAIVAAVLAANGTISPAIDGFEPETKLFSAVYQARLFYRGT